MSQMRRADTAAHPVILPFNSDADASVRATSERITVENLTLLDADAAQYVLEQPDETRADTCRRALKVGLLALRQSGATINIDYMNREMERFMASMTTLHQEAAAEFERALLDNFGDNDGRLPKALERYFGDRGDVQRLLSELFDDRRRDSAIGKIQHLLDGVFGGDAALLATLLNPTREGSPLHAFRAEIRESLGELTTRVTALDGAQSARANERKRGTAKGVDFETSVHDAIAELLANSGDVIEDTSRTVGDLVRAKKGDLVIHVDPATTNDVPMRVAIEIKSGPKSWPVTLNELRAARANRNAEIGIAIFAPNCAPRTGNMFAVHGSCDIVCEYDPEAGDTANLLAVVMLARTLARMRARSDAGAVDTAMLEMQITSIRTSLTALQSVRQTLNSITKKAEEAAVVAERTRRDIVDALVTMESTMNAGVAACAPAS